MKRTCTEIIKQADGQAVPNGKITCELIGEFVDGAKVWAKLDKNGNLILDEQYAMGRIAGKYFFIRY